MVDHFLLNRLMDLFTFALTTNRIFPSWPSDLQEHPSPSDRPGETCLDGQLRLVEIQVQQLPWCRKWVEVDLKWDSFWDVLGLLNFGSCMGGTSDSIMACEDFFSFSIVLFATIIQVLQTWRFVHYGTLEICEHRPKKHPKHYATRNPTSPSVAKGSAKLQGLGVWSGVFLHVQKNLNWVKSIDLRMIQVNQSSLLFVSCRKLLCV